jgi:cholesterol transport system auxiliary component
MKLLTAVVLMLLLAGCGGLPKSGSQAALYDFGIAPADAPFTTLPIRLTGVEAAPGLEGSEIRYRLAYQNPARVFAYTESRWVASPEKLISRQIERHLIPADPTQCKLQVKLESFDQVFDTADSSKGVVLLRANLTQGKTQVPVARISVETSQVAISADARGGVEALILATDNAIGQILAWAANQCHDEK